MSDSTPRAPWPAPEEVWEMLEKGFANLPDHLGSSWQAIVSTVILELEVGCGLGDAGYRRSLAYRARLVRGWVEKGYPAYLLRGAFARDYLASLQASWPAARSRFADCGWCVGCGDVVEIAGAVVCRRCSQLGLNGKRLWPKDYRS